MRKLAIIVCLINISLSVFANGDPVMRYSAVCRVANPEPLTISDISIVKEIVNIKREGLYNCFDITYTLANKSEKDYPAIDYGFPIDYEESEYGRWGFDDSYMTESIFERGWNPRFIKDVSFQTNGNMLPFQNALESIRASDYDKEIYTQSSGEIDTLYYDYTPEIKRRWYYTQFGINRGDTIELNVKYKVYASTDCPLFNRNVNRYYLKNLDFEEVSDPDLVPFVRRFFLNDFTIHYDFKKAKHFGDGIIKKLIVNIDLSNLRNPIVYKENEWEWKYKATQLSYEDWEMRADSIKPIHLHVNANPYHSVEERWAIVEELAISANEFTVKTSASRKIEIELTKPRFVSEVALQLDTMRVKSIEMYLQFANGRRQTMKYELESNRNFEELGEIPPSDNPVFLPIVDSYIDRYRQKDKIMYSPMDFDCAFFQVKRIELLFPDMPKSDRQLPYDSIRLLDSRWD
ncbi:hypothetical protein [Prevotella sp. HUN102]|uniref:hypothetical protein n=1 Tax=Prevotella sp. HUN102 TaxID=1392486 RepID=UPI000B16D801|nr:hypothetical protein [Prevotella sp. HUN102]